ncbi:fructose-2,6-bisphosphatase [Loigolactobacillus backii]|uniref:histidine phosphatase family protein n=1 Tax=Loigolactobacillus backii TaxID=375175 RepID=UPI000C1C9508|nr:histidine phosphatase family protein [Loigolactobacillus backii]PIO82282.1 fructose-2,6-bisphosphatase [Loigolactobacillus backii]
MTEFYFIRHGQTLANTQGVKQGTTNTPATYLNKTGKAQVTRLHERFDISFADRLLSSPLERTKQTAAILNATAKLPVSYDERLTEISYGEWDGLSNATLQKQFPAAFSLATGDVLPSYAVLANGETFAAVEQRTADFMAEMVTRYPAQRLIIVTHGFTVRSFAYNAVQASDPLAILEPDNASVTKITGDAKTKQLALIYYNRLF